MRRFGILTAITGVAAAAVGLAAGPATASLAASRPPGMTGITTITSPNYSGYAAVPKPGGATAFTHVQASYVVPAIDCGKPPKGTPNGVAYQVAGLDGITSPTIEQVGVREVCMGGIPGYLAWYQMYPSPVHAEFGPAPGDVVDASVSVSGGVYKLSLQDVTSGQSFTATATCATCNNSSAEVLVGPHNPGDFGTVRFGGIAVTDSASKSGGLSDPKYWNTDKLVQPPAPHHGIAGPLGPSAFTDTWA